MSEQMLNNVYTNVCFCTLCGKAIYDEPGKKLCNRCTSLRLKKSDVVIVYFNRCGQRVDYKAQILQIQADSRWCQCGNMEEKGGYDFDRLESY